MLSTTDRFFSSPIEEKSKCKPPTASVNRGYTSRGTEALAYSLGINGGPPDLNETFKIGPDSPDLDDPAVAAEVGRIVVLLLLTKIVCNTSDPTHKQRHRHFAPNIWPSDQPELRRALTAYMQAARTVIDRLTLLFARALGLESNWFH